MKKLIAILAIGVSTAHSQTMYKMQSPPIYDEDGQMYQMRQVLDHLPTPQDSADFEKAVRKYLVDINIAFRNRHNVKQYQAVVAEVRINKKGHVAIKPTSRFKSPWYRYPDPNVKVGDTIWISREDAIEPKFD